jgi:hypothetical protein
MGDQAGDSSAAGRVGTQDLAQENPEGDQGGKDPVQPATERGQRLLDHLFGEGIGERQLTLLEKLPPEKADLIAKGASVRMTHRWGLLATDGVVAKHHLRK